MNITPPAGPVYVVQAFDANHMWVDTSPQRDGYFEITGVREMLKFIATTKRGTFNDFNAETSTERLVAYWVVNVGGIAREIFVTPYGATCTRTVAGIKDYGPGCHARRPVPTI